MGANRTVVVLSTSKSAKIVKWKVSEGTIVYEGRVILLYDLNTDGDDGGQKRLKATEVGTVRRLIAKEGEILSPGEPLFELEKGCSHPTVINDLCAECGADLRKQDSSITQASVPMIHSVPELKVSEEQAENLGKADEERLLKARKLVLLVDLDQTLIHTTNDNIPNNIKDVYHFQLYKHSPWYHTRLRPGTHNFLTQISNFYELHICTFGARNYAHMIAHFLDPDGKFFSHRILSRDECFDPNSKTANLKALFPVGDRLVCIIDDREDVWNYALNLIHVKPYHFFQHTGDINAPPGLTKRENDDSENGFDFSSLVKGIKLKKKPVKPSKLSSGSETEDGELKDPGKHRRARFSLKGKDKKKLLISDNSEPGSQDSMSESETKHLMGGDKTLEDIGGELPTIKEETAEALVSEDVEMPLESDSFSPKSDVTYPNMKDESYSSEVKKSEDIPVASNEESNMEVDAVSNIIEKTLEKEKELVSEAEIKEGSTVESVKGSEVKEDSIPGEKVALTLRSAADSVLRLEVNLSPELGGDVESSKIVDSVKVKVQETAKEGSGKTEAPELSPTRKMDESADSEEKSEIVDKSQEMESTEINDKFEGKPGGCLETDFSGQKSGVGFEELSKTQQTESTGIKVIGSVKADVEKNAESESNEKKNAEGESNEKKNAESESNVKKNAESESNVKKNAESESNEKKNAESESNDKKNAESESNDKKNAESESNEKKNDENESTQGKNDENGSNKEENDLIKEKPDKDEGLDLSDSDLSEKDRLDITDSELDRKFTELSTSGEEEKLESPENTDTDQSKKQEIKKRKKFDKKVKFADEKIESNFVELEEMDDYLLYLEEILRLIHQSFYAEYDKTKETPDLKSIIPKVKQQVLAGSYLVFSGLVPTHIELESTRAYLVAVSLGAVVTKDLDEKTTHIVAVRSGTAKVNAARRKRSIKIVTPDWLWQCAERWEKVDERLYPVGCENRSSRHPPAHCASPEHSPNREIPFQNVPQSPLPSPNDRFMDSINPLMSFSSEDIATMAGEVEDILDGSESDSEEKVAQPPQVVRNPEQSQDSSNASSSSSDSLTGERVRGWGHSRKRRREATDTEIEELDADDDESLSSKFRRGEALPSDLDLGDDESVGSDEPPDEISDGDWNMLGAALEKEFLEGD